MFFSQYTLVLYLEASDERRLSKALSPHLVANLPREFQVHFSFIQITVGFYNMLEIGRSEHCPGDFFKSFAEFFKVAGADGYSGSGRMPAEFEQKAGVALGNKIQRVT